MVQYNAPDLPSAKLNNYLFNFIFFIPFFFGGGGGRVGYDLNYLKSKRQHKKKIWGNYRKNI